MRQTMLCRAAMKTHSFALAALFAATPALADASWSTTSTATPRPTARLLRFNGTADRRRRQSEERAHAGARAAGARCPNHRPGRQDAASRLIDAHGHVMGLGFGQRAVRPDRHRLARRVAAAPEADYAAAKPKRAGSSAAAGTRSSGRQELPDRRRPRRGGRRPAGLAEPGRRACRWSPTARR